MRKDILINGVDCSSIFTRYGYNVSYKKVNGNAGGTMLDGSTTVDVIAIKAVITLPILPLIEAEMLEPGRNSQYGLNRNRQSEAKRNRQQPRLVY